MIGTFGLDYLIIGNAIGVLEHRLRAEYQPGVVYAESPKIHPDDPFIWGAFDQLADYSGLLGNQELGPVWAKIYETGKRLAKLKKRHGAVDVARLSISLDEIKRDFHSHLRLRKFYFVRPDLVGFYGQQELFGPLIAKKFKDAAEDLEHAGNCLALGEYTATVLHLMRAMEAAIRTLAKKLKVTISPRDTWGAILSNMDTGIKALPEKNARQRRKKDMWSECRVNLYHVKSAWRDNSMHGKRAYTDREARQIIDAMKTFMAQLATL